MELLLILKTKRTVEKTLDFRQNIVPAMQNEEFQKHFHMSRKTFDKLLSLVGPCLPEPYEGMGKKIIPPVERLYIVLWFLTTTETHRQLAARFGTTESVVHESVDMVLNVMSRELKDQVQFPLTVEDYHQLASAFSRKNGFPGIVGSIDGTHIPIMKPKQEPDAWIDRKGNHSMAVAAVVDSERRFLFYSVGCPGSYHDQRVYRLSGLEDLVEALPDQFHLVGDSAYTLSTNMLVPYKDTGRMTQAQKSFNYKHSCNRMVVEHTFGILKNKFPRIHYTLQVMSWQRAAQIITVCILLHNFIINTVSESISIPLPNAPTNLPSDKVQKRDAIMRLLQDEDISDIQE